MRGNIDRSFEIKCVSLKYPVNLSLDCSLKDRILSVERDFIHKHIHFADESESKYFDIAKKRISEHFVPKHLF